MPTSHFESHPSIICLSQLTLGEWRGTPWTSCHRDKQPFILTKSCKTIIWIFDYPVFNSVVKCVNRWHNMCSVSLYVCVSQWACAGCSTQRGPSWPRPCPVALGPVPPGCLDCHLPVYAQGHPQLRQGESTQCCHCRLTQNTHTHTTPHTFLPCAAISCQSNVLSVFSGGLCDGYLPVLCAHCLDHQRCYTGGLSSGRRFLPHTRLGPVS